MRRINMHIKEEPHSNIDNLMMLVIGYTCRRKEWLEAWDNYCLDSDCLSTRLADNAPL